MLKEYLLIYVEIKKLRTNIGRIFNYSFGFRTLNSRIKKKRRARFQSNLITARDNSTNAIQSRFRIPCQCQFSRRNETSYI